MTDDDLPNPPTGWEFSDHAGVEYEYANQDENITVAVNPAPMPDGEDLKVPEKTKAPRIDGHGWAVDLRVNKDTSAEQKLEYGERTEDRGDGLDSAIEFMEKFHQEYSGHSLETALKILTDRI